MVVFLLQGYLISGREVRLASSRAEHHAMHGLCTPCKAAAASGGPQWGSTHAFMVIATRLAHFRRLAQFTSEQGLHCRAGPDPDPVAVRQLRSAGDAGGGGVHIWRAHTLVPVRVSPERPKPASSMHRTTSSGGRVVGHLAMHRHCSCRGTVDAPGDDLKWSKWGFWLVSAMLH